ncbi:hypothetical protein EVAR_39746_1 [Eumeta japonica]|uniref:Uncharacterized protein n=1 Tax=Eumeta variegata TaxID=151549 RepID=A0A4C1X4H4_EUMVA|nr:hypothetical protein EVAR_39746_1 [Eumeta japonica]
MRASERHASFHSGMVHKKILTRAPDRNAGAAASGRVSIGSRVQTQRRRPPRRRGAAPAPRSRRSLTDV